MTTYEISSLSLEKCPTGIIGFDEVTGGGLPKGRTSLLCGNAGCGKTLFGMEFLINGIVHHGEPGVFMAFEETSEDLAKNVRSLGFDLDALAEQKLLVVDHVHIEKSEIEETGDYDLDGLFIRLNYAIDSIGAKRVALDTLETLFSGLTSTGILRAELRRLFQWLKTKGVTAIVTAERGQGMLTRHGLEEYISDCVVLLDHRVSDQIATRRLRVVKYRGSAHGTNEYPFLIDEGGLEVLPITSIGLDHPVSEERISSGIPRLDLMLDEKGYYRGSSVLVSGTAGAGKSSMAATFVAAACQRGERSLYFAFEESPRQIYRNMRSIGIDLEQYAKKGLLAFRAARPTTQGLETHLATMYKTVRDFKPQIVVVDPITNFISIGPLEEVKSMLVRLMDYLKSEQITALFTNLNHGSKDPMQTDAAISSLIDTWLLLRDNESSGERNRVLHLLKSRGMPHSNQVREFLITCQGIDLLDVYTGPEGVLTGSARLAQETRERVAVQARELELMHKQRDLERKRRAIEAQIAILRSELEGQEEELDQVLTEAHGQRLDRERQRLMMASSRKADPETVTGEQDERE